MLTSYEEMTVQSTPISNKLHGTDKAAIPSSNKAISQAAIIKDRTKGRKAVRFQQSTASMLHAVKELILARCVISKDISQASVQNIPSPGTDVAVSWSSNVASTASSKATIHSNAHPSSDAINAGRNIIS